MSFINKFKDTANVLANKTKEAGSSIGSATKTAVEKSKIKSSISKAKSNIDKQYAEIGKKYVELYGNAPAQDFVEYIDAINVSKDEIEKLNAQLNALEDCVVCACGARVPKGSKFCPTCGSVIAVETTADEVPAEAPEEVVSDDVEEEISATAEDTQD